MTVIVTTEISQQTQFGYETLLSKMESDLKTSQGLILHSSHRLSNGWRIVEIWKTPEAANRFFVTHVAPNLPTRNLPFRSFQDLHNCISPELTKNGSAEDNED